MKKLINDEYNRIVEWNTEDIARLVEELKIVIEDRDSAELENEILAQEAEAQMAEQAQGEWEAQQRAQDEAEYYAQQGPEGEY